MRNIYLLLGGGLAVFFIVLLVGIMKNPASVTTSLVRSSGTPITCSSGAVLSVSTLTPYAGDTVSASYLFPAGTYTDDLRLFWNIPDGNPTQITGSYAEKNRVSFAFTASGTKTIFVGQTSGSTYNPTDPSCTITVSVAANTGACSEGGAINISKRNVKIGEIVTATLPSTVPSSYSVNWSFQDGQPVSPTPNPATGSAANLRTVSFAFSRTGSKSISAQLYAAGAQWNPTDPMCTGSVSVTDAITTPSVEKTIPAPL